MTRSPYASAMMFKPHPKADERRRSAVALIKYLLAENRPEAWPAHIRELLTILLWKITEAEAMNKRGTRLQSQGARGCTEVANLEHDHVYQRAKMIDALERAAPHEVDVILKDAIGCTVTVEEHTRLSKVGKEYDGWDRYRKAGILVFDTQTDKQVT
jgi:hypothetical protein